MSHLQPVTVVVVSGALVFGMALALLGGLKFHLARSLDLAEGRVGTLLSAFNLALIPVALCGGVLIDRWAVRGVLVFGSVVLALAVLAFTVRPTYPRAFLALLLA